jgi:hypothetical protein
VDERQVQFAQSGDGKRIRRRSSAAVRDRDDGDKYWEEGKHVIVERADGTVEKLTREQAAEKGFSDEAEEKGTKGGKK